MVASHESDEQGGVVYLTPEQGYEIYDRSSREITGMSAEEFLRRWDAGEYDALENSPVLAEEIRWQQYERLADARDFAGL